MKKPKFDKKQLDALKRLTDAFNKASAAGSVFSFVFRHHQKIIQQHEKHTAHNNAIN